MVVTGAPGMASAIRVYKDLTEHDNKIFLILADEEHYPSSCVFSSADSDAEQLLQALENRPS